MKVILGLALFCLLIAVSYAKKKAAGSCPGCPENASANDEKIQEIAEFAVGELGYTLTEILEAKTQVVQGTNYILTLKVKDENDKPHRCEVEVWEKLPGESPPTLELTSSSCENIQRQRMAYFFSSF